MPKNSLKYPKKVIKIWELETGTLGKNGVSDKLIYILWEI